MFRFNCHVLLFLYFIQVEDKMLVLMEKVMAKMGKSSKDKTIGLLSIPDYKATRDTVKSLEGIKNKIQLMKPIFVQWYKKEFEDSEEYKEMISKPLLSFVYFCILFVLFIEFNRLIQIILRPI